MNKDYTIGEFTLPQQKTIKYKFGEFTVSVMVDENNKFIGVDNISVDRIFYNHNHVKAEFDVAKYYEDDKD